MADDHQGGGPYETDRMTNIEPQHPQEGVPDRDDTGGGPRGGNTVDGRTGPGQTGDQDGPGSTLRAEEDFSGDGFISNQGGSDDLRPLGGWTENTPETPYQTTHERSKDSEKE